VVAAPLRHHLQTKLASIALDLQQLLRQASPETVSGDEAQALVGMFADIERGAAAGVALYSSVVVETGSYAKTGHGTAADWLGSLLGSSASSAKGRLSAAARAGKTPELADALHEGELSADQLKVMTQAAVDVPEAVGGLLDLVGRGASHQELTDTANRMRANARSRESAHARRARVHATRHLRQHQADGGGVRGEFFCDEVAWARFGPALEADAKDRWRRAGSISGESLEAHRLDAFVDWMTQAGTGDGRSGTGGTGGSGRGGGSGRPRSRSRAHALVIVDAEALRRGTAQGDELCEIEGIGPVSVEAATELLSEAGMQYLVREGFDIRTATRTTRFITSCVDMALIVRDRTCAVPGCGRRLGLERDHWRVDYGKDGPTELENLVRLCPIHHDMKTHGGWRLSGGPGHWRWIPPRNPPSAGRIARSRKVAAAKAKARKAAARATTNSAQNWPQRE
jgi:hypothetical protein